MARPLNPRQLKFVELYLLTGNAKQSYIDAGYKQRGDAATAGARQLLENTTVQAAINGARSRSKAHAEHNVEVFTSAADRAGVTAEWVFRRLKAESECDGEEASPAARVAAIVHASKLLGMVVEKSATDITTGGKPLEDRNAILRDRYTASRNGHAGGNAAPDPATNDCG